MSSVSIQGNASGTGTLTIAAPNTNTDYTLTLPQATTTIVGTDATQTLTNKTIQGGAITSGTAVASTSGTSIDFTGIPSWVKRITVMFSGVSTSGTSNYLVQLGDSGGFETSAYVGQVSIVTGGINTLSFSSGFLLTQQTSSAAFTYSGAMTITLLGNNNYVETSLVGGGGGVNFGAGSKTLSDTLTQVRITTVNGTDTFDAGTINIMYE